MIQRYLQGLLHIHIECIAQGGSFTEIRQSEIRFFQLFILGGKRLDDRREEQVQTHQDAEGQKATKYARAPGPQAAEKPSAIINLLVKQLC